MKTIVSILISTFAALPAFAGAGLGVGDKAQGFSFQTLSGETTNLAGLLGKRPLLLWFTNL